MFQQTCRQKTPIQKFQYAKSSLGGILCQKVEARLIRHSQILGVRCKFLYLLPSNISLIGIQVVNRLY